MLLLLNNFNNNNNNNNINNNKIIKKASLKTDGERGWNQNYENLLRVILSIISS